MSSGMDSPALCRGPQRPGGLQVTVAEHAVGQVGSAPHQPLPDAATALPGAYEARAIGPSARTSSTPSSLPCVLLLAPANVIDLSDKAIYSDFHHPGVVQFSTIGVGCNGTVRMIEQNDLDASGAQAMLIFA